MEEIKQLIIEGNKADKTKLPRLYMFKNLYEDGNLTVVYENKEYFAIVPSNEDGPTPLDDTAKSPMSLIHVLVCPKVEIWNAVDIEQMKLFNRKLAVDCADKAVALLRGETLTLGEKTLTLDEKLKPASLENRLKDVNDQQLWSETATKTPYLKEAKKLSEEIEYSFHLYPNNSVNHLHMHAWCPNLATISLDYQLGKGSKNENGEQVNKNHEPVGTGIPDKNAPLDTVLEAIKQLSKVSEKRYAGDTRVQEEIPGYIKSAIQPKPEVHPEFGVLRY